MHSFITTSAVGGLDGHQFQDVHMRASDGMPAPRRLHTAC